MFYYNIYLLCAAPLCAVLLCAVCYITHRPEADFSPRGGGVGFLSSRLRAAGVPTFAGFCTSMARQYHVCVYVCVCVIAHQLMATLFINAINPSNNQSTQRKKLTGAAGGLLATGGKDADEAAASAAAARAANFSEPLLASDLWAAIVSTTVGASLAAGAAFTSAIDCR